MRHLSALGDQAKGSCIGRQFSRELIKNLDEASQSLTARSLLACIRDGSLFRDQNELRKPLEDHINLHKWELAAASERKVGDIVSRPSYSAGLVMATIDHSNDPIYLATVTCLHPIILVILQKVYSKPSSIIHKSASTEPVRKNTSQAKTHKIPQHHFSFSIAYQNSSSTPSRSGTSFPLTSNPLTLISKSSQSTSSHRRFSMRNRTPQSVII